jgi:molybdopterin-guanine dinucleotide biosynthesis protein A
MCRSASGVADVADDPRTSAIVLAGGRSSRFGAQKLAIAIDGTPLLHRALGAVAQVCDEVLVVGSPDGLPVGLPAELGTRLVTVSDERPFEGPLSALIQAARIASHERLLVVGGDMPWLRPALLRRLLAFPDSCEGACLWAEDRRQPMPLATLRSSILGRGADMVESGERRLRRFTAALDVEVIPEVEWRALDPDAHSLRDIDRPEDLEEDAGA